MTILLDRRNDGSVAFFLDGDLQFDSRDEHIYHECLALPALALAEKRKQGQLTCLILGGGDGLTARELLKSNRVDKIDLVDYDESVLQLARSEFAAFNLDSLSNPRVRVCLQDARQFVKAATESGATYDVVISDFTAPQTAEAAQLHSVEFYSLVALLLGPDGVLAANTVSPSGTSEAYWSIYNSILSSRLKPRPYRIFLPSFTAQDYGADWGFIIASPREISAEDINSELPLAQPRKSLKDHEYLRQLFYFPEEDLQLQPLSQPAAGNSDILVHYLFNPKPRTFQASTIRDALSIDLASLAAPAPAGISYILPPEARMTLSDPNFAIGTHQDFVESLLAMVPAVRRDQTREMLDSFLEKPVRFLQSINLSQLVQQLLQRATELPQRIVEELRLLQKRLVEFGNDYEQVLNLGMHVLAVISLVVIIGNLIYPDAVYAKGAHADASAHAGHAAGGRGRTGVGGSHVYGGGNFYGGGYYGNNVDVYGRKYVRTLPGTTQVIQGPGKTIIQQPGPTNVVKPGLPSRKNSPPQQ